MNGPSSYVTAVNGPVAHVDLSRTKGHTILQKPKVDVVIPKPMGEGRYAKKGSQNLLRTIGYFFTKK